MSVVTRFPPSPTGYMHIGNARTALYNWLYARHHGGKFLVRIEDTDRARHNEDAVRVILEGLAWLGLDYDGEVVSQFARRHDHAAIAQKLLEKGEAYKCYCTPEELEEMRETARKEGLTTMYDRRWRDRDPSEAPEGVDPVIRIKAPLEGETVIEDEVQGKITIKNETLDDFIILRSDGTPTYMLSVVCDDHDMGVTHVIRGDDHMNNAFRQQVIYEAMGWDVPVFAHLPLIHGPDGGKFSKRHGASSVEEYKDMGYLAEAMKNYLLRLGWSHGDDEIIPTAQAVEWFDLDAVGKSASRFDFKKLENLNAHYIKETDNEELLKLAIPFFKSRHELDVEADGLAKTRLLQGMEELKDRATTLWQLVDEGAFYARSLPFEYDEKASSMLAEAADVLPALYNAVSALSEIKADDIQQICKDVAAELREGKMGKTAMPLRAALTGVTVSPSIFHAAEILGKEETLARLQAATDRFSGENNVDQAVSS